MTTLKEAKEKLIEITWDPIKLLALVWIADPLKGSVKFQEWPHLLKIIWVLLHHRLVIIVKARQIGISWLLAIYALWIIMTKPSSKVLLISKGEREATELLAKSRYIYQHLPDWLKPELSFDSATVLGIKAMDSKIVALPSTEGAGRGEAATVVIGDEWDYHEYAEANYGAMKPTIDAGGQFIAATTINKAEPDNFPKQMINAAIDGKNNFKLLFYNWRARPGRDDAWYEQMCKEYPEWQREGEYPNTLEEAMSPLSARSVFDKVVLQRLFNEAVQPVEVRADCVYILHPPKVGYHYVAGGDVGEGVGLDYSALTILGLKGMSAEVCAVIHSNTIKTDMFAYQVDKLCREYFNPMVAVENNSIGVAVINALVDLRYPRLYGEKKDKLGWHTGTNRTTMIDELSVSIRDGSILTFYKPQVIEMMRFQWKEGRPDAPKNQHDDLIFSLAIANQMLRVSPVMGKVTPIRLVGTQIPETR